MKIQQAIVSLIASLLLLGGVVMASEADREQAVQDWLDEWVEKFWERYHPDYDSQYPGGRSNRFHDQYVSEVLGRMPQPPISSYSISNRHFMVDGDWFVAEWFYDATQDSTGWVQRESTVAFGKIVDDQLIVWIEYFDDSVGNYQRFGALPLYEDDEMPYPWPAKVTLRRDYRP